MRRTNDNLFLLEPGHDDEWRDLSRPATASDGPAASDAATGSALHTAAAAAATAATTTTTTAATTTTTTTTTVRPIR